MPRASSSPTAVHARAVPNRTTTAPSVPAAALLPRKPPSPEECEQEARLRLWQLADRLESLPPGERPAYAATVARHAAFNVLRLEMHATETTIPLEALGSAELIPEVVGMVLAVRDGRGSG